MGKRYPDTRGEFGGAPTAHSECCACKDEATAQVRIAWDYMRGNDDWVPACNRHRTMAENQSSRFIAHMLTKDRHFENAPMTNPRPST